MSDSGGFNMTGFGGARFHLGQGNGFTIQVETSDDGTTWKDLPPAPWGAPGTVTEFQLPDGEGAGYRLRVTRNDGDGLLSTYWVLLRPRPGDGGRR